MSAMQRGQLVALASPALRTELRPCWPSKPAATWLLVAALLGISLQGLLPALASAGLRMEGDPPAQYADLLSLLRKVFTLSCVDPANLQLARSAAIYKELTCTFPTHWWSESEETCFGTTSGRGCRVPLWRLWRSTSISPSDTASWMSRPTGTTGARPPHLPA